MAASQYGRMLSDKTKLDLSLDLPLQDWKKKHELDRKQIKEVVCALCETRQPVADHCQACGVAFGGFALGGRSGAALGAPARSRWMSN